MLVAEQHLGQLGQHGLHRDATLILHIAQAVEDRPARLGQGLAGLRRLSDGQPHRGF